MKKALNDKRGIAMESAIMFMLVVFMFGLLLTGVTMTSHLRVKVNDSLIQRELEIEQIGENFVRLDKDSFTVNDKYQAETSYNEGSKILTLYRKNTPVLYIEVENNQVILWKYTLNEDNNNG